MRFTFVILLFCCLGADAQMIIKAHANYRPYAVAVAQNLLLDDYSGAAAAYSLRKLDKDYTGSAIRVRRSNDNTEQDIGFTASGDLDTASLKTFVGANSGFVTTWYDQSGNARNATQTTAANQPRVVNAGVVERKNGKPMINYDGTNDRLAIPSSSSTFNFLHNGTKSFISLVSHVNASGTEYVLLENINANPYYTGTYISTFGTFRFAQQNTVGVFPSSFGYSVNNLSGNNVISTNQFLATINIDADNPTPADRGEVFINNANAIKNNTQTSAVNSLNAGGNLTFGSSADGTYGFLSGGFQEILIYGSDQSSNRTGIQSNINTHYGIY